MINIVAMLISTLLASVLPALASEQAINKMCPVMTEQKVDPDITATYRGKTVAVCCDSCLGQFKADPERYIKRLPQFASVGGPEGSATMPVETTHHAEKPDPQHDHGGGEEEEKPVPFLGRLHPLIVHFPVAGIPLAFLGFLVWMVTGREMFAKADVPVLLAAAAGSVAAVITGNIAHDAMRFGTTLHDIVGTHQILATATMIVSLALVAFRLWRWNGMTGRWAWIYGGGLFIACMLVGATGYMGGSLVFGPNHLKLW